MSIKKTLKNIIPPIVLKTISNLLYGWSGNYKTWAEAKQKSSGYNTDIIFNKVKNALLKVKNGEAVYERDSVLFDKKLYSFPLLSALSLASLKNNGKLNVLDFGGSLGSSYFQNKDFFENSNEFSWNIVEQEHFVEEGKKTFSNKTLSFYKTVDECLENKQINILLLSSVLQYIEKPYELLDYLLSKNIEYLLIDRAPVLVKGLDRITIQTVPKSIYEAKYPCWLLNDENLKKHITTRYNMVFEETTSENININNAEYKTYFFIKK